MMDRLISLLGPDRAHQIQTTTFHRFCLNLLREEGHRTGLPKDFILCSERDTRDIAADILYQSGQGRRHVEPFLRALPVVKSRIALDGSGTDLSDERYLQWGQRYQDRLRDNSMLDLDDLEIESLRLLRDHPEAAKAFGKRFSHIFVDEYQDTNAIQVSLLKHLVSAGGGQPIDIAHVHTVDEEAEMIVAHIDRLMGGISHFSMDSGRVATHAAHLSLGFGDIGVVYRLNQQGNAIEKALIRAGIPFIRSGDTPLIDQYPANILWRLFYVGMTRARSRLILSHVDRRPLKGPVRRMQRSVFLKAIPTELCRPLDRGDRQPRKKAPRQLTLF